MITYLLPGKRFCLVGEIAPPPEIVIDFIQADQLRARFPDNLGNPLQFQFALDGQVVQDWSDRSTWVWTADQAGVHTIQAQARDGKHGMQGDSSKSASFEILEIIVLAPSQDIFAD